LSSARLYHDVCEFFALLPDAECYEEECTTFCEKMCIEHAPRMARSLQGAELALSREKQKELLYHLSIKPSVFTEAVYSFTKQTGCSAEQVKENTDDSVKGHVMNSCKIRKASSVPKVSILLPAFNAEKYCAEAIASMLGQTFADYELIVMDDCSTDNTWEIVQSFKDSRIRLYRNKENLGITSSLNKMLSLAKGEYFARMDADDISVPNRLALQVDYMDKHPDIWVCGGLFAVDSEANRYVLQLPVENEDIRVLLPFACSLPHPFVMLNGAKFRENRIFYDKTKKYAQDYALWIRISCEFPEAKFANLPVIIGHYRKHEAAISTAKKSEQDRFAAQARIKILASLGIPEDEPLFAMHKYFCSPQVIDSPEVVGKIFQWAMMMLEANAKVGLYDKERLEKSIKARLQVIVEANSSHGSLGAKLFKMMYMT